MAAGGSATGRRAADAVLIAALATGATTATAADLASVSTRTVYRRLDDPTFCARVDDARAELVTSTLGRLVNASTTAADTLAALLADTHPPTVRLSAARAILDAAQRWRTTEELADRLTALEQTLTARAEPSR